MLFNSHEYLFVFLPIVCAIYAWLAPKSISRALGWLTIASLGFYAWWEPANLVILVASLVGNFCIGRAIERCEQAGVRRAFLALGIVVNLLALVHFKYAVFLVENLNQIFLTDWQVPARELPLGISFFTFQQIAYLCDIYRRRMSAHSPWEYGLFVSFFPQLIAGPIVRPDDVLPQFRKLTAEPGARQMDFAVGLTLFALGLFKKTVLADGVAGYASPAFAAAHDGVALTFCEAWGAALAYTFQLYFDFSGYSDMASGSARLFGIRLPWNFNSPYQASSIGDFWRRWHMTLSSFLREFVYIPLGGSRCSAARRTVNLMLTMLIGGVWHGAGWTYIAWGGLHGAYLAIDHAWQRWRGNTQDEATSLWARPITFLAVVVAWVLFRAPTLAAAGSMYAGMAGLHGLGQLKSSYFHGPGEVALLLLLGAIVWWMPNSAAWCQRAEDALASAGPEHAVPARWDWSPSTAWGVGIGVIGAVAVLRMTAVSEFVYFQF